MKRSAISSFLHRVRIHGGEFGASARAMHREAALENVSSATTERKIMSTKTTFKRIALVAVAAVGFGMLTGVAANAATSIDTTSNPAWSTTVAYTGSGTAAASQIVGGFATLTFSDTTTSTGLAAIGSITSTGVGTISNASATGGTHAVVATGTTGGTATFPTSSVGLAASTATTGVTTVGVTSSVAGLQTLTATTIGANGAPGTSYTATITWIAAAAGVSLQYSTVVLSSSTGSTAVASVTAPNTVGTQAANIAVTVKDSNQNLLNDVVSATVSGPGTIGVQAPTGTRAATSAGRALSLAASSGTVDFSVYPDGTSGVSTITITDGTVVLGTATVTFYGAVAKVTATQNLFVAKAGSVLGVAPSGVLTGANVTNVTANSGTPAVYVALVDANGTPVSGKASTLSEVSSNSSVIVAGSFTEVTATPGTYEASVSGAAGALSGQSATVTFKSLLSDGVTYISSAPITFTIGGSIAKVTLSLDAASYTPLSPLKLVAHATDSSGNAAYDQDGALFGTLTASTQLGGALLSTATASTALINGTHTFTGFYSPAATGDFTVSGTDSTSAANAVSATATVAGGDSSAAVDAANAATDAANYAADAADAATTAAQEATAAAQAAQDSADAATAAVVALGLRVNVLMASVRAQLTSLSNLLVRIIKKTHA